MAEPTAPDQPQAPGSKARAVLPLGLAQTLAWASSYYLPAMLARPMARELEITPAAVFAAFSLALVVSAAVGPLAGRAIDRHGGRRLLLLTNLVFAVGLVGLAASRNLIELTLAWAIMGVAMGAGLYEAAFASLVRLYGRDARHAITGVTLMAGLASTVGWPLTAAFEQLWGWRGACGAWALLHLAVGLPLNAWLPAAPRLGHPAPAHAQSGDQASTTEPGQARATREADPAPELRRPRLVAGLLAFVFAATWFTSTAMATHLPTVLQLAGATPGHALAAAAMVGPAQVAGRLLEFGVLRHAHPLLSARLAAFGHPLAAALLLIAAAAAWGVGTIFAPLFALLHGLGNGILTIAKGTLPLALFGAQGYGERQGWLMLPARAAQALAPWTFGVVIEHGRVGALALTLMLGLAASAALLLLPWKPARAQT